MGPQHSHRSPEHSEDSEGEYATPGTCQPAGQEANPNHPESERVVECTKDEDFRYWDGNVILLLQGTAFKLHASRLASYCGYFRELFSREIDGCGVYYVPPELSTNGFKHLLRALDSPLEFVSNPPSQGLAISLLFAAHTLSCDLVLDLAKHRLAEIWDRRTLLLPSTTKPLDSAEDHIYPCAIRAIKLARAYSIPDILRRAFYELLSNQAFWDALDSKPLPVHMSEADICTLLAARVELGRLWRDFIMQVPERTTYRYQRSLYDMRWCCNYDEEARAGAWRSFVFEKGALEVYDPLRYDFMAEWSDELRTERKWCQACLDRKQRAAEEKRRELWERMDQLFGL